MQPISVFKPTFPWNGVLMQCGVRIGSLLTINNAIVVNNGGHLKVLLPFGMYKNGTAFPAVSVSKNFFAAIVATVLDYYKKNREENV